MFQCYGQLNFVSLVWFGQSMAPALCRDTVSACMVIGLAVGLPAWNSLSDELLDAALSTDSVRRCQKTCLFYGTNTYMYTGILSISETISHRRNALFGHVARLPDDVPAHKALNCQVNLSLGPPSSQWHRRPGRPRNRWVDQIRNDNNLPPADLWRRAVSRGHRGATLRLLLAKR